MDKDVSACFSKTSIRKTVPAAPPDDEPPTTPEERPVLREELLTLREALARLEDVRDVVVSERGTPRREAPTPSRELEEARRARAVAEAQLAELRRSSALRFIERVRDAKDRFFPRTRLRGRCLELSIRLVRVTAAEGPRAAAARVKRRVASKAGKVVGGWLPLPRRAAPRVGMARPRFLDLPWRGLDRREAAGRSPRPPFKILLVSHSACRTGAPLCLLRLVEELSKLPGVECWVVLRGGGDLAPEFVRRAPTLDVAALAAAGVASWGDAPDAIAARFREYAPEGIAVCNTMAVGEFHEALRDRDVPVVSWVHELPTFIEILGGADAIERVKTASRRIIVPADVVRDALVGRFDADPDAVRTLRYGLEPKTIGKEREPARRRVREELGFPADARIVLGCGTIDPRKGADLFVQAARRFLADPAAADLAAKTRFVWFGREVDPDFNQWLRHDVEASGLDDRVVFAGTRPDMTPYLLAADAFALTSREDPCPFANLEAMEAALPVVAFAGSGGAPEVLGDGGVVVPYLDVAAMADALGALLRDDDARAETGRRGRSIIRGSFTWPRFMAEFLAILRDDYGMTADAPPKVSAIVPNYRHAPFLEERLRSVFEQTVRPHEIIFLDDHSPDDSLEVARRLAPESPVPMRIVVNDQNGGSTFKQWMKGMDLATGDLIWLAESDDVADPRFLERLVPEFRDPAVALAYCQSALVGPGGELWAPDFLGHTDDVDPKRWRRAYKVDAAVEAEIGLSQKNVVPNASAAVFRKPARLDFAEELAGMKFAGDWLFYAMILRGGKIAYAPESLNFYRRHEASVSFQATKADTHAEETLHAKARVFETYDVSPAAMARGVGQTLFEYDMLSERFGLKRPPLTANPRAAGPLAKVREIFRGKLPATGEPRVLLLLDEPGNDLEATAAADLARALAGDRAVFVCRARPKAAEAELWRERFGDRVVPLEGTFDVAPWSVEPAGRTRVAVLREMIRIHEIDVIHSRGEAADRLAATVNAGLNLPWFVDRADGPDDGDDADPAVDRRTLAPLGLRPDFNVGREPTIARREGEFLVFLIDRGPRARDAATRAVRALNRTSAAERNGRRVRLVAADAGADVLGLISQCDAAVAPGEGVASGTSLRIVAALARGLPVVAPDSGPVHDLLTVAGRAAGIAAAAGPGGVLEADRVAEALSRYMRDPALLDAHRERARTLFDARFHVDRAAAACAEAYAHARDFLVFPRPAAPRSRSPKIARESA